jgi:TPR repeat protein
MFTISSYIALLDALGAVKWPPINRAHECATARLVHPSPGKRLVRVPTDKRSKMRTPRDMSISSVAGGMALALMATVPSSAQTAADAAGDFARALDGGGVIVSDDTYLSALESDAAAGRPLAMWQLGTMYENGQGVGKDPVKAFGYYSQIAIQHADTAPRGLEADIVARSFVKLGDYFREGAPEVGINQNPNEYHRMLMHAATYFGDAEAQYRVGVLYQQEEGLGLSPTLSARWLQYAANKGHCLAQARLGELLYNGMSGYSPRPAEGLMWLNVAQATCIGTPDQASADTLLANAMRSASPDVREAAITMASSGAFDTETKY